MAERTYTIPLRNEWLKVSRYKRAKKAVNAVKAFVRRHMKLADDKDVRLGMHLNMALWQHGIQNPPARVKIHVKHDDVGAIAELEGKPFPVKHEKQVRTGLAGKLADKITGAEKGQEKKEESKPEAKKEEPKESKAEGDKSPKKAAKKEPAHKA